MTSHFQCDTFLKQLRSEHQHLDREVLKIRDAFQKSLEAPLASPARRHVVEALQSLRAALLKHFRQEESEGCLWEAASFNTSLCGDVKKVLGEHPAMLERLDAIIGSVEKAASRGDWAAPALAEFDKLARIMAEHEAREIAILESSFPVA